MMLHRPTTGAGRAMRAAALLAFGVLAHARAADEVATPYTAYTFAPEEGWRLDARGDAGASALDGRSLRFDFTRGAESVGLALPDRSLPGRPARFHLRIRGAAKGHPVEVTFHTHFMTFFKEVGTLDGDGEQTLTFDAPPGDGWRWGGGENDGKIHGPLRLGGLRLRGAGRSDSGTLELLGLDVEATSPADRRVILSAEAKRGGGAPYLVTARALFDEPRPATLRWVVRGWDGQTLSEGRQEVTLPPGGEPLRVAPPVAAWAADVTFAEAEFALDLEGQATPPALACWLAPVPEHPEPGLRPESPFGMGVYLYRAWGDDMEAVARTAGAAGVKWSREEFSWAGIEPEPGRFRWEHYDQVVSAANRNGITVYGILGYWAPWAKEYTPEGIDAYVRFVRAVVTRYGDRIKLWEVWNEPNIFFWQGPKEMYGDLLAKTYAAIKEVDPEAQVLGLSTAGIDYAFIEKMVARGAPFDILTVHPYRGRMDDRAFLADLRRASDLVRRPDGTRRPVWLTELGWATFAPHNALGQDFPPTTERAQAEYLTRCYLVAIASGVEPVTFWYDFRNDGDDPVYFEHNLGIVRRDLSPKPAYAAYATMTRTLAGLKPDGALSDDGTALSLRFRSADGRRAVTAAWSPERAASVRVPVSGARATVVNAMGEVREVAAEGGAVLVELGPGRVVYVVDEGAR